MKTREPLITVYITNYNYVKYIRDSIESVIKQKGVSFELLIIDDGSTDNSKQIIEEYATLPFVKVIYQKNIGLNVSNNIALKLALGEYIIRLDADDFLEPNALKLMVSELELNPQLGLIFPDYYEIDSDGAVLRRIRRHNFNADVSLLDMPAHGACTMIRTDCLRSVGGYDESYTCQDGYDLWLKFLAKYEVTNINIPLFCYRLHGNNLTENESRILGTRFQIKERHIKKNRIQVPPTYAVIPVRKLLLDGEDINFIEIKGQTLLERKIDQLIKVPAINQVIVSSDETRIGDWITKKFKKERVSFQARDIKLARQNEPLEKSVLDICQAINEHADFIIGVFPIEFPLLNSSSISEAIYTLEIFQADSVISVRPDDGLFFQHSGSGLVPILDQDKFTRLEREALFKFTGGIMMTRASKLKESGKLLNGKLSHVVVPEIASIKADSKLKIQILQKLILQEPCVE